GFAKARVPFGVAAARARGDLNLFNQLREELAALGVQSALLVFDGVPLRVSGHTRLCSLGKNFRLGAESGGNISRVFSAPQPRSKLQVPSSKLKTTGLSSTWNLELATLFTAEA